MEDCKKMKVLYVTHYSDYLGANRSLLQLIKLLKTDDISSLVVVPNEGEFSTYLRSANIEYIVIPFFYSLYLRDKKRYKNVYYILKGCLLELLNVFFAFYYASFVLKKEKIDIVHTNSSAINIGAYLAFFLKVKHVWHVREFLRLHYGLCFPWGVSVQRYIMRNMADVLIPISKAVENYLKSFISKDKLHLIYNGVVYTPNERTVSNCPLNIVMVGVIHPSKRQFLVIQVLHDLLLKGYTSLRLTIVGNVDNMHLDYYNEMQEYIEDNNLEEYVTFTGYMEDIAPLLSNMHVGILASENEAFGRVTVEYMMSGLVPIVANSGGSVEIIVNGVNGFVFNDKSDLTNILILILNDKNLMKQITEKAIQTANERFTGEINALNVFDCYKTILQS